MSFSHEFFSANQGDLGMGKIIPSDQKRTYLPFITSNFGKISQREMARNLGIGKTTINSWSKELGLYFKKHTVNENFFDSWSEKSAYVLGYIYADGNVAWNPSKGYQSLTITAAEKDKDNLEKIRNLLSSTKPLLYSKKTKSYRLIANNKILCLKLMELGVVPRKSKIVTFPKCIPPDCLRHFLRGVIDGDGNIFYLKRKRSPYFSIRIYSGSEIFLRDLAIAVEEKFGIPAKVKKANNSTFGLEYSCSRGKRLGSILYSNANLYMERKYIPFKENVLGGDNNGK